MKMLESQQQIFTSQVEKKISIDKSMKRDIKGGHSHWVVGAEKSF